LKYRYLIAAELDAVDAAAFYESRELGLGTEFVEELDKTVLRILEQPYAGSPGPRNTRRFFTHRFPYSVVYRIGRDEVLIVAVQHHSQNPRRWQDRISE